MKTQVSERLKRAKKYDVGQRVITVRNISLPDNRIILRGAIGEIIGPGKDGQYPMKFGSKEVETSISPVWNAPVKPIR